MTDTLQTISGGAPHDLIAYSWFVMGFRPRESLVVVGLHGERLRSGAVARLDLPHPLDGVRAAVSLADLLERGGDDACLLMTVSDAPGADPLLDDDGAMAHDELSCDVAEALARCGFPVVDALLVGPDAYRSYLCRDVACCPPAGLPLSAVMDSRVAATMVLDGRCVADDESALVADVAPVEGAAPLVPAAGRPGRARRRAAFDRWCADLAAGAAHPARPEELLAALRSRALRDAVLATLVPGGRDAAEGYVAGRGVLRPWPADDVPPDEDLLRRGERLLAAVARLAPEGDRAAPLAALGWLAWWSGQGVRARLLVARALEDEAAHPLALLVGALVEHSVPPPWRETAAGVPAGAVALLGGSAPGG